MKWADMHNEPGEGKSLYRLVNRETGEELDRKFLDDDCHNNHSCERPWIPRFHFVQRGVRSKRGF